MRATGKGESLPSLPTSLREVGKEGNKGSKVERERGKADVNNFYLLLAHSC